MQNQPLVSIITPGYNCGSVVHRLLDSILAQTWQNIEFIFVNDGSTDNTAEVLESYREKFEARGIAFRIIAQENRGVGEAIQTGLKAFHGDYLCWPDADDYLEPDAIKVRAEYLEQHPEFGIVTGQAIVRRVPDLEQVGILGNNVDFESAPAHFENALHRNTVFCPGCHMIRTSDFLKINPEREIYPSRHGQNWQMLLPMYYHYQRGFIAMPVYNYLLFPNSMSREKLSAEKRLAQLQAYLTIPQETLKRIAFKDPSELEKYGRIVTYEYGRDLLLYARDYKLKSYAKQAKELMTDEGLYDQRLKRLYREATNPVYAALMRTYRKLRG